MTRRRKSHPRVTRSRALTLVVLATVAVASGCGVPGQREPTVLDDNGVHVASVSPTTSIPSGVPTRRVDLCLVADDRLVIVPRRLTAPLSVARTLQALVDAPAAGLPAGTRSTINNPDLVTARATTRGVAHIDLNAAFTQIPAADQILALAQVVCTLTSLPGIGQIRFTRAGSPVDIPRADSSLTDQPVARADYASLLPPH